MEPAKLSLEEQIASIWCPKSESADPAYYGDMDSKTLISYTDTKSLAAYRERVGQGRGFVLIPEHDVPLYEQGGWVVFSVQDTS